MKPLLTAVCILVSFCSRSQIICGTANENGTVTLTAPAGNVFTTIEFASYGTPNGSCGSFTMGSCHAANSVSICSTAFVGRNSASLGATNGIFGDPCPGTFKRLYVQAAYAAVVPLTLFSFTAKKTGDNKIELEWVSSIEINTSEFIIEKSTDGLLFESIGVVAASGNKGNRYRYTAMLPEGETVYQFRLKMLDNDGRFAYSNILLVNSRPASANSGIYPNPAGSYITVTGGKQQEAFIINSTGQIIYKFILYNGSRTVNIHSLHPGVYFIKSQGTVLKFIKK